MKQLDRRWQVLLVTGVAVFMAFLDVTIVNVAFPSIGRAFPSTVAGGAVVGPERLQHRLRGAAGAGGAAGGPARAAADVLHRAWRCSWPPRRCAGSRRRSEFLIGARVLQAAGAALLVPTSLGLLLPEFPPERRASATALWGAIGGVAAATGPSLGGLLIEWADWRLVFFVNLALGAAVVVPARRLLRETRDPDRGAVPDALGIGLLAGGVGRAVAGDRRGAGLGLGERAGAGRVRGGRGPAGGVRVALGGARAPGARAVAVPRAVVRGRLRGRRSCSRWASTPCCWPTSCS